MILVIKAQLIAHLTDLNTAQCLPVRVRGGGLGGNIQREGKGRIFLNKKRIKVFHGSRGLQQLVLESWASVNGAIQELPSPHAQGNGNEAME